MTTYLQPGQLDLRTFAQKCGKLLLIGLLTGLYSMFMAFGNPEGDIWYPQFGASLLFGGIMTFFGPFLTLFFGLTWATAHPSDKKAWGYRTIAIALYTVASLCCGPFLVPQVLQPMALQLAYVYFGGLLVWQLPREKPWLI